MAVGAGTLIDVSATSVNVDPSPDLLNGLDVSGGNTAHTPVVSAVGIGSFTCFALHNRPCAV